MIRDRFRETFGRDAEVIAVAVHSPALVPESDLQDAIAGIHELTANFASEEQERRTPVAA